VEKGGRKKYITERNGIEEAAENGTEPSHPAHASGMNDLRLCEFLLWK